MKKLLFIIALFSFTATFAQDTAKIVAPPDATAKILSKADSFMAQYAAKQHVDTNMSTDDLLALADKDKTLIPKGSPAKNPFAWLKFLSALLFLTCAIYYKVKHGAIQAKALAQGIKLSIILVGIIGMLGISSCKTSSLVGLVTATQTYVEKHCPSDTTSVNGQLTIHYKCDSLWNTSGIKAKCPTANICVDVANAAISVNLSCPGLIPSISSLVATPAIKK